MELALPGHAGAAARLDASDDMLMRLFSPLALVERLRLATVSKRWRRLLQSELHFPTWHNWRAPAVARRAGSALRVLDISTFCICDNSSKLIEGLVAVLGGAAGTALHTLIAWDDAGESNPMWGPPSFSPEQALQLSASCPRLDSSTRVAMRVCGAEEAVRLLDALPGRHAVLLMAPAVASDATQLDAATAEPAALDALLRHPRLCGLSVCL